MERRGSKSATQAQILLTGYEESIEASARRADAENERQRVALRARMEQRRCLRMRRTQQSKERENSRNAMHERQAKEAMELRATHTVAMAFKLISVSLEHARGLAKRHEEELTVPLAWLISSIDSTAEGGAVDYTQVALVNTVVDQTYMAEAAGLVASYAMHEQQHRADMMGQKENHRAMLQQRLEARKRRRSGDIAAESPEIVKACSAALAECTVQEQLIAIQTALGATNEDEARAVLAEFWAANDRLEGQAVKAEARRRAILQERLTMRRRQRHVQAQDTPDAGCTAVTGLFDSMERPLAVESAALQQTLQAEQQVMSKQQQQELVALALNHTAQTVARQDAEAQAASHAVQDDEDEAILLSAQVQDSLQARSELLSSVGATQAELSEVCQQQEAALAKLNAGNEGLIERLEGRADRLWGKRKAEMVESLELKLKKAQDETKEERAKRKALAKAAKLDAQLEAKRVAALEKRRELQDVKSPKSRKVNCWLVSHRSQTHGEECRTLHGASDRVAN